MPENFDTGCSPTPSEQYWRGIFLRNPDFCSWQEPKQLHVRNVVRNYLSELDGQVRVLDFGIGSLGLYRTLEDDLLRRLKVTGTSESQQHDSALAFLIRHTIDIAIGPGLLPLARLTDGSQDRLVCSYVFDYLSDQLRADALRAFCRVMADGAKLVLVLHHPRGKRAKKFRRSRTYWPLARRLYDQLMGGRYAEASVQLQNLTALLNGTFEHDDRYRGYLKSYLTTAERFLSEYWVDGGSVHPVPKEATVACERAASLVDRESAMTCSALRPIEEPTRDLALPNELLLSDVVECTEGDSGAPIANVLTAIRRARCNAASTARMRTRVQGGPSILWG